MDTATSAPTTVIVGKRKSGIAGEFSYTAQVTYEGEEPGYVTFTSSVYGPPIVMTTDTFEVFVSQRVLDRIGSKLTPEWVRAFFAPRDES